MITIPLSDVVAFLQRKGVDLACLEGAPIVVAVGAYVGCLRALNGSDTHPDALLYLGSGPVCPAATGWASEVLRVVFDSPRPCVTEDAFDDIGGSVCLWGVAGRLYARWTWTHGSAMGRSFREVQMDGDRPSIPAARLRAVLLHEMGRA